MATINNVQRPRHRAEVAACQSLGRPRAEHTSADIGGTDDDTRFRSLLSGMDKYRFDGVAAGTYTVELDFAELQRVDPGEHLFDVVVEGVKVLPALDIADAVGTRAVLRYTFPVRVTDGSVDVQFVRRAGFGTPTVNAIRVTHRPDLG